MENGLQNKLALFAENAQQVAGGKFKWHNAMTRRMAALIYAQLGKQIDIDAIQQSYELIKESTGAFSAFRGTMALCIATMLSQKDDQAALFDHTKTVYEMMKEVRFYASEYLVVAAFQIAAHAAPGAYQQAVARTRAFYDGMKANSFWRTGQDDYIFAAMLGLSNVDVETGAEQIERLYQQFKSAFGPGNSVQTLAQVLVLSGDCEAAANRVLALRYALRDQNLRLDKTYTLPSLGVLALLPVEQNSIVQDILEAQAFLRAQKGFSSWTVGNQELLLYAAALVASEYAEAAENGVVMASVSTSITNIIIAQQAAMIAAITASSAAAASSSN